MGQQTVCDLEPEQRFWVLEKPDRLCFRNEISLTVRFENDFGESEWFAIRNFDVNQQPAPNDAYLVPSCLFARTPGEWQGDGFSHAEWSGK